jgi:hypothetical protein
VESVILVRCQIPCTPHSELRGRDRHVEPIVRANKGVRAVPAGARVVDTAASGDASVWGELTARALAGPPPYRPVPGDPVYHLRVDEQVVLVAEHDLSGPLSDLVTAVLAIGEAVQ